MQHYVGQRVTSRVTFTDADDVPFDPSSVRVTYRVPGANRRRSAAARHVYGQTAGIRRAGVGVYVVTFLPTEPGEIEVVWESVANGEEALVSQTITVVAKPEIVTTFTGPNSDDNRFTGPNSDDNR